MTKAVKYWGEEKLSGARRSGVVLSIINDAWRSFFTGGAVSGKTWRLLRCGASKKPVLWV